MGDIDDFEMPALSPAPMPSSHNYGRSGLRHYQFMSPGYGKPRATAHNSGKLEALPSSQGHVRSGSGRVKSKWSTVKLADRNKEMADTQTDSQAIDDKAHTRSPVWWKAPLSPHDEDRSIEPDSVPAKLLHTAPIQIETPERLTRHLKWAKKFNNDLDSGVRARRSGDTSQSREGALLTSTTHDRNVSPPAHLQQKINGSSKPNPVFTTSIPTVQSSSQRKKVDYTILDSFVGAGGLVTNTLRRTLPSGSCHAPEFERKGTLTTAIDVLNTGSPSEAFSGTRSKSERLSKLGQKKLRDLPLPPIRVANTYASSISEDDEAIGSCLKYRFGRKTALVRQSQEKLQIKEEIAENAWDAAEAAVRAAEAADLRGAQLLDEGNRACSTSPVAVSRNPMRPRRVSISSFDGSITTSDSNAATIEISKRGSYGGPSDKWGDLDDHHAVPLPEPHTPGPATPSAISNTPDTLQPTAYDDCSGSDLSNHASTHDREDIAPSDSESCIDGMTGMIECFHCESLFGTRSPVKHCPDCAQSSGLHVFRAVDHRDAESVLRTTLQSTVEEEQAIKFRTPPSTPRASKADDSVMTFEHALFVLNLQQHDSVDFMTLSEQFNWCLARMPQDHTKICRALAAVMRHQNGECTLVAHPPLTSGDECQKDCEETKSVVNDYGQVEIRGGISTLGLSDDTFNLAQQHTANDVKPAKAPADAPAVASVSWTDRQDQQLMMLKAENNSWLCIGEVMDKHQMACKNRFKEIKPKDWKAKNKGSKTGTRKDMAEKQTTASSAFSKKLNDGAVSTSDAGGWGAPQSNEADQYIDAIHDCEEPRGSNAHDGGWGTSDADNDIDNGWGTSDDKTAGVGSQACHDGWGTSNSPPPCGNCGHLKHSDQCCSHDRTGFGVDPGCWTTNDACPGCHLLKKRYDYKACGFPEYHTRFKPCDVSYWATIESDGEKVHVPIDSKHVSGPEKTLIDSVMPKVWKWIHDKGLGVCLGEAFELAHSMHEGDKSQKVDTQKVDTRAESRLPEGHYGFAQDGWGGCR